MKNKIIIVGPGGSGKDFLRKKMVERGFEYGISFTSRPPRENEKEGVDYFFRDDDFFQLNKDVFLEIQQFNGWYYGISKGEFEEKNLFILDPKGVKSLNKEYRSKSFVIYINPPEEVRIERLKNRNDADNVDRRLKADREDFFQFLDYDIMIKNEDF
jgi:guanylate kinase